LKSGKSYNQIEVLAWVHTCSNMIWKKKLVFNGLWVSVAKKQRQSILLQQMNDGEGRSIQEDDIPALLSSLCQH
jgi:hypothetical protein